MFGDKCCYIHPNIRKYYYNIYIQYIIYIQYLACKYGYYCTRIGCSYSHPAGFNPGMGFFPNLTRSIPSFKGNKKKFPAKGHPGENTQGAAEGAQPENENPEAAQQNNEKVEAPAENTNEQ